MATPTRTTAVYEDECVQLTLVSYPIQEIIILRNISTGSSGNSTFYAGFDFKTTIPRQIIAIDSGLCVFAKSCQKLHSQKYNGGIHPKNINYIVNMTSQPIDKSTISIQTDKILLTKNGKQFIYSIDQNSPKYDVLAHNHRFNCSVCNGLIFYCKTFYENDETFCHGCEIVQKRIPIYIINYGQKFDLQMTCPTMIAEPRSIMTSITNINGTYFSSQYVVLFRNLIRE